MGFFSNIIRDSHNAQKGISGAAVVPQDKGPGLIFPASAAVADGENGAVRLPVKNAPTEQLREESTVFSEAAWQDQGQAEAVARQVVNLSPVRNIPFGELAQVRVNNAGSPNPETREQTGSASDATVTDTIRTPRAESRHGDGSFDVPVVQVSASDSSIREYSSASARSRAGTTAVETQGRQQAEKARAGLATPPGQSIQHNRAKRPELPLDQPSLQRLNEPSAASGQENAAARFAADSVPGEANFPPPLRTALSVDQPFAPAADAAHKAPAPLRSTLVASSERPQQPNEHVLPSGQIPMPASYPVAPASRKALTAHRTEREKSSSRAEQRTLKPQVQIGTIEVVVTTQAPSPPNTRSEPRLQADPVSRHYLRNF